MKLKTLKSNKKTLVSIIIPVFNGSFYLEETVSSIQKSKYKKYEIILVNDGSGDKSKHICLKLAKKYKKVRFYDFDKNRGMGRCLNFAISKAKGKYIARLNQDDLIKQERLSLQVKFLENHIKYVAIGGTIDLFNEKGKKLDRIFFPKTDEDIRNQWLFLSPFSDPTVMFRKNSFLKTKGYQQSFWPADDIQMWYQLGKIGKLANFKKVLTRVRWHDNAGSIKFHRIQIKKTWKAHVWAAENVQKPNNAIWAFWIAQYIAGTILPARFNWFIFRILRKIQASRYEFSDLLTKIRIKNKKEATVINQPSKLSISGQ